VRFFYGCAENKIGHTSNMRLHRFYYPDQIDERKDSIVSNAELLHQWKNVFRYEKGQRLTLFNGEGIEYACEVVSLTRDEAVLHTLEKHEKPELSSGSRGVELWLVAALIKKDNFEWIIQKATELGVSHIVPVVSERSEKKNLNMERAQKLLVEASEQSGRATLPTLNTPEDLDVAIESLTSGDEEKMNFFAFDPSGKQFEMSDKEGIKRAAILIGPEGGWSDKELDYFRSKNIPIYSIGSQILRAETAAVAISTLLLLS